MTDRSGPTRQALKPCFEDLPALVEALASEDGLTRTRARRCLVRQGDRAAAILAKALTDGNKVRRAEAAEALLYIASPSAAMPLVEALDDSEFGVRWLAAEALIALKCDGLVSVLEGVTRHSDSLWFRRAAHHVLHDHYCDDLREELSPVLAALDHQMAEDTAPVAAREALRKISVRKG